MDLNNETTINVAALLREQVGAQRSYDFSLDSLFLDDNLEARDVTGQIHLTRLSDEILATVDAVARVELECQRCLEAFTSTVPVSFSEEFRVIYDVKSGAGLDVAPLEEDQFEISAAHELDVAEPLRQEIVIALPMRPICGPNCSGPPAIASETDGVTDSRFAILGQLLGDDETWK